MSVNKNSIRPSNIIEQIEVDNLEAKKKQYKKQLCFVLLLSILQLTAVLIKNTWKNQINDALYLNVTILLEVLLLIFFSIKFLGLIIYSHELFSMISLFLCLFIFFIESIIYHKIEIKQILIGMVYYFSVQFFYCLSNVLGKKYLNTFPDNIYAFLFKLGILGLIPLSIYGIIISFLNVKDDNKIFQNMKNMSVALYLLDICFTCLYEIGLWLTLY